VLGYILSLTKHFLPKLTFMAVQCQNNSALTKFKLLIFSNLFLTKIISPFKSQKYIKSVSQIIKEND